MRIKSLIYRAKGFIASPRWFGLNVRLLGKKPIVDVRGRLLLNGVVTLRSAQFRSMITVSPSGTLTIGSEVFINQGLTLHCEKSVVLEEGVKIGDQVLIYDTNFHPLPDSSHAKTAPVIVGKNVWIGSRAILLPGVTIGHDSVIAAGSVVTKSFPENSLIGGNPAVLIRSFSS